MPFLALRRHHRQIIPAEAPVVCDACGGDHAALVLRSPRLDGPLMRCSSCGLHYVANPSANFTFNTASQGKVDDLVTRVLELDIVRPEIEQAEGPWRSRTSQERLRRVRRHVEGGRLLDVGCATGAFLRVASGSFEAMGVEPDAHTSQVAREAGLRVQTGTIADVAPPPDGFDAITMFHVIEHLKSPRRSIEHVRSLIREGGVLVVETPTIDTLWFRLAKQRWRQLLPDHYFFFSRATLATLLGDCGFRPVEHAKVGRHVSLRFAADRARRAGLPLAEPLRATVRTLRLDDVTVYVNPGDIMTMTAIAR